MIRARKKTGVMLGRVAGGSLRSRSASSARGVASRIASTTVRSSRRVSGRADEATEAAEGRTQPGVRTPPLRPYRASRGRRAPEMPA